MRIVGIDPGVTGALALIKRIERGDPATFSDCADMPTVTVGVSKKRQQVDGVGLVRILKAWDPDEIYIELVNGMAPAGGKIGSASAFNFGEGFGILKGVVAAMGIRHEFVTPVQWKKLAGVPGGKEAKDLARGVALQLFPTAPLERKKDHARADALLIAEVGSRLRWAL